MKKIIACGAIALALSPATIFSSSKNKKTNYASIIQKDNVEGLKKAFSKVKGQNKKETFFKTLMSDETIEKSYEGKVFKYCLLQKAVKCFTYLQSLKTSPILITSATLEELINLKKTASIIYLFKNEDLVENKKKGIKAAINKLILDHKIESLRYLIENKLLSPLTYINMAIFSCYRSNLWNRKGELVEKSTSSALDNSSKKELLELNTMLYLINEYSRLFPDSSQPLELAEGELNLQTIDLLIESMLQPSNLQLSVSHDKQNNYPYTPLWAVFHNVNSDEYKKDRLPEALLLIRHLAEMGKCPKGLTKMLTASKKGVTYTNTLFGDLAQIPRLETYFNSKAHQFIVQDFMNFIEEINPASLVKTPIGQSSPKDLRVSPIVLAAHNNNYHFLQRMLFWLGPSLDEEPKKIITNLLKEEDQLDINTIKLLKLALTNNGFETIKKDVDEQKQKLEKEKELWDKNLSFLKNEWITLGEANVLNKLQELYKTVNKKLVPQTKETQKKVVDEALKLAIEGDAELLLLWILQQLAHPSTYKLADPIKNLLAQQSSDSLSASIKNTLDALQTDGQLKELLSQKKGGLEKRITLWKQGPQEITCATIEPLLKYLYNNTDDVIIAFEQSEKPEPYDEKKVQEIVVTKKQQQSLLLNDEKPTNQPMFDITKLTNNFALHDIKNTANRGLSSIWSNSPVNSEKKPNPQSMTTTTTEKNNTSVETENTQENKNSTNETTTKRKTSFTEKKETDTNKPTTSWLSCACCSKLLCVFLATGVLSLPVLWYLVTNKLEASTLTTPMSKPNSLGIPTTMVGLWAATMNNSTMVRPTQA